MRKSVLTAAALIGALVAVPAVGHAQEYYPKPQQPTMDLGQSYPRFGFQGDWGGNSRWGFGGRLETGITSLLPRAPNFRLVGSFDFFPRSTLNYWELNANLINVFPVRNVRAAAYLGTGLNLAHTSPDVGGAKTDLGLNLIAGIRLPGATFRPFLESRLELGGGGQFMLTGGFMFH